LLAHELVGGLATIAEWKFSAGVQLAGACHSSEQIIDMYGPKYLAGSRRVPLIALYQSWVGAAYLRDWLTSREVNDLVNLNAVVRLAPAEHRNFDHQSFLRPSTRLR
jgi:hypothetical protein